MIHSNTKTIRLSEFPRFKLVIAILSLCIALGLLVWALNNYQPNPNFYGPRAIYSLTLLSVALALLGRILLLRQFKMETEGMHLPLRTAIQPLFLFDITAPLYLAATVLIGPPAAVLLALITQTSLQGFTLFKGFVSWTQACYRIASTALLALISGAVYTWIAGPPLNQFITEYTQIHESKEFLGSIVAALVMMLLIIIASLLTIAQANRSSLKAAWQAYLQSSVLRFQLLVLSVGPLLPVVDIFDNVTAELAWLFFLVPLFAIYYLALISTRLSIRTFTLQRTLQDLSSARRRQDELRDYASLITRVQEEERRRLARELHDDTAQALIALSLGLDGLGRAIGRRDLPEKDVQWLANLQELADRTLEGVRRACRDLRPSVLDDLGLRAALEWLSDSSSARGVPCTFTCTGSPRPTTPEAEIAIFRIIQEALSNIWRHAQATQASVELAYLPSLLQLTVRDNGKGFFVGQFLDASHNSQSGLGLVGMRERAMLIGATLAISSALGDGCKVELSLPLPEGSR
ncbi:MAG TPA: sensor histidine kinase [Ktedonobacteraceae bacterium]|nr:sensor histidine kinase [Ktedonobacteraceae bacterium]